MKRPLSLSAADLKYLAALCMLLDHMGVVFPQLFSGLGLPAALDLLSRCAGRLAFPIFAYLGGGKHGIKTMFRHIARPALMSLGTCSSTATIPTNLKEAEDTGIPKDVADMVIPMGATMHMDGSCFSCVLKIAFVLGAMGADMSWSMLPAVVAVAVLSSVGMSGVPGGGYIGEFIMCSVFFPDQMAVAYPIAITIGNLVDPPATMINSSGDYVVSFVVSRFVDGKDWFQKVLASRKS